MEDVIVKFKLRSGNTEEYTPLNFKFVRERYTPYIQLTGAVVADIDISRVVGIELLYGGRLLHKGMPDSINKSYKNGRYITSFLSRGYTLLLGQNEPEPGVITDVNLSELIRENISGVNIGWEVPTNTTNYIFVKERSTIWDAICTYAYKEYGNYPYIRNEYGVYVSVPSKPTVFNYNTENIVTAGEGTSTAGMLTDVYMSDTEGNYSFSCENSMATGYGIVRRKYYPFDRQWLSDPLGGLRSRLYYSNRGLHSKFLTYTGHRFENLMDKAVYTRDSRHTINSEFICGVEVVGNKKGVFTKVTVYNDSYH